MRILLGLLALALILACVLHYGQVFSFDAAAEANKARAALKPGMTWEKVVKNVSEPRSWRIFVEKKLKFGDVEQIVYEEGPEAPFMRDAIAERVSDGTLPGGFSFRYDFHSGKGGSLIVMFDGEGRVEDVYDGVNLSTLLDQ